MIALRQQGSWCRKAQIIMSAALLVIVGSFYLFGYRPLTAEKKSLAVQVADRQKRLADNSRQLKVLPEVAAEVRDLRARLDGQKKLPRESDLFQFIRDLTRLKQNWSLSRFQYKPEASRRNEYFAQLPIQLSFEGDFVSVYSFLRQIEDLERLTRVRTISLKGRPEQPGEVQVELTMNIYYAPHE